MVLQAVSYLLFVYHLGRVVSRVLELLDSESRLQEQG